MSPRSGSQTPLSVGILVHEFPVYSETFVVELAEGLLDAGCSIEILTLLGEEPGSGMRRRLTPLTHYPPRLPKLPGALGRGADVLRQAVMLRGRGRFDVVHCQFATVGLSALRHVRLKALRSRALVVHLRGYDITTFVTERGPEVYRALFETADIFIANCAHFRDRAIALGCRPDKVVVVGSPIDTVSFSPPAERQPLEGRPVRLVAVGRLVEKKGFGDAIAAVALLRDSGRVVELDILGDGRLRPTLEAEVDRLGLRDAVRFHGATRQDGVIAALHAADIALTPSVTAASGDEDAAVNTAKEAMATGLPVIGTRHGGIPELVVPGENGDLVPERDPAALATAIARMIDNHRRWPVIGGAGRRKVVAEYDRAPIIRKTLEAYELALTRAGERV